MAMFGLTEPQYNIVKQQARNCTAAIKGKIDTGSKYDHVAAAIIHEHHTPVQTLVTFVQFTWLCGYLTGRFGNRKFDYE